MVEIRQLDRREQPCVLPLLGRCFPDYWEQIAATMAVMPFDELSFAAFADEKAVGHCGVMRYAVSDGRGGRCGMAGIASVAVAPEFRGRGLAGMLCEAAARWAEAEPGVVSLPLYTAKFRVYEKSGWRRLELPPPRFVRSGRAAASPPWRTGAELTPAERDRAATLYASGPDYPGKVVRGGGGAFHDWPRIFAEPDFRFAVTAAAYAILVGETLAEVGFAPGAPREDFLAAALGPAGRDVLLPAPFLRDMAWETAPAHADPRHGEAVMVRELKGGDFHREHPETFYSLIDKF